MSSNDTIVLDGILADCQKHDNQDAGRTFEQFAFEQVLKDYALTKNQLDDGWIDGGGDGGIDGLYVIVNGYPYGGDDGFQWPRENPHITIWVITCKHNDGFVEAPLASMHMTLSEFWDCSKGNDELSGVYSNVLLDARSIFLKAYNTLAHLDPLVEINIVYASRGDAENVSDSVKGRMEQLKKQASSQFSKSQINCQFIGAKELLQLYRKVKDEDLHLPYRSYVTYDENNYVAIVRLRDYFEFVRDADGKLRRYLFDSNVRDFLGYNNVNADIDETLKNPSVANFWWLNNGITILVNNAHVKGKILYLNRVQIVNGLQTTETLYRHFAAGYTSSSDKDILIKIITSQDEDVRTNIIQATNNQSNVMSYSLHATDDVQRNIEDMLRKDNIYYERRDHYYKNEGMPIDRFITPLELARAFLSVVYKNPASAASLKNKFMRNGASYNAVFCSSFPIDKWSLLASIWIRAEQVFQQKFRSRRFRGYDYSHQWLPLVSCCVVAKLLGTFKFTIKDIRDVALIDINDNDFETIWTWISPYVGKHKATSKNKLKSPGAVYNLVLHEIPELCAYEGIEEINQRQLPKTFSQASKTNKRASRIKFELTEEFLSEVREALPPQPWKPGVHRVLARNLSAHPSFIHDAIEILIERGEFCEQKDGVVYKDGKAILVDNMRCKLTVDEINAQLRTGA